MGDESELTVQMQIDESRFKQLLDLRELENGPLWDVFDEMIRVVKALQAREGPIERSDLRTITGIQLTKPRHGSSGLIYLYEELGLVKLEDKNVSLGPLFGPEIDED